MMTGRPDSDDDGDHGREGSEPALMLGYCRGEREAFERLYSRVAPSILSELVTWCGDRPRAEALLDRTFQALHACRATYVQGAEPGPWISQIARREFVLDCRQRSGDGSRRFWSGVLAAFTRTAPVELKARS